MPRPFELWTVLPHGKLAKIGDNLMTVVGVIQMPLMKLPRRMTVVRLADSNLVVWSAIALDEPGMAEIESFGRPAYLVVPGARHRLDAKIWKARYPSLTVVAPAGARAVVAKVVPVDMVDPHFGDPNVQFTTLRGTGDWEAALIVRSGNVTTLVLNDIVGNIDDASGVGGWLLGVAGFAGNKPQIPRVVKRGLVKDPNALRAQFLKWAEIESLQRILVSHGSPVETDARATLRDLARSLE